MNLSSALLVAAAVVLLAVATGVVMRAHDGRRRKGGEVTVRAEDVPGETLTSTTLVQFSTEFCARCPQVRRLLSEIAQARDLVQVEIDLTNRNDLATWYGVLQTPTTFLVDASGAVLSRWGGVPDRRSIETAVDSLQATQE